MKRVVSISLGTSKRDKTHEVEILGEPFRIERCGTDGDLRRFESRVSELDGEVDAIGVGGADVYVVVGEKRYAFKQIQHLIRGARTTPIVDGSGLKHTLERETIRTLASEGIVDFSKEKVLLVSAVDRFGMAQALVEAGAQVVFGDLMFALGLPIKVRSYDTVRLIGALSLPVITRLPFKWFYPTGEKQETRTPKFGSVFREATLICGDWHFIRRYAPDDLSGKTILTQTVRKADLEWLAKAGVTRVITTTPVMGGETFATNVMEAVLVTVLGKRPEELVSADYLGVLRELKWQPNVIALGQPEVESGTAEPASF